MPKKLLVIIILIIVIASAVTAYWVSRRAKEQVLKVGEGDFVTVNYTIWLNDTGALFSTSTVSFTVGFGANVEGVILKKFDLEVLNLTAGETIEFVLEPWDAFGNWSWERVKNISALEKIPKFEVIKRSEFEASCPEEKDNIGEGVVFTHWVWNWNSTIVDVEGDNITIEHLVGTPAQNASYIGLVIQSTKYDWNSTVINITGDKILLRHNAVEGMSTRVVGKGKVLNITNETALENQEIVVDLNHELVGKTLKFRVTIVDIKKKGG
ncbi:MAG: FKBP-type peptidyl-prolyl cis-trans isomerase [Candidatus Thermoplasmatota archaeon]|nr:FKBP-type peptidyl-prolyl cis-trans isomerase [Candidatus Thermoplasmatota archaeon]